MGQRSERCVCSLLCTPNVTTINRQETLYRLSYYGLSLGLFVPVKRLICWVDIYRTSDATNRKLAALVKRRLELGRSSECKCAWRLGNERWALVEDSTIVLCLPSRRGSKHVNVDAQFYLVILICTGGLDTQDRSGGWSMHFRFRSSIKLFRWSARKASFSTGDELMSCAQQSDSAANASLGASEMWLLIAVH